MTIQIILKRDLYPPIDQITGQGQNRSLPHRRGADAPAAAIPTLPARHGGSAMLTAAPMHGGLEVRASLCDSTPGVWALTIMLKSFTRRLSLTSLACAAALSRRSL